jgi:hypothetical protein
LADVTRSKFGKSLVPDTVEGIIAVLQRQCHCLLELFSELCPLAWQIHRFFEAVTTEMPEYSSTSMLTTFKTSIGPIIFFITHQCMANYSLQCTSETQVRALDFPPAEFSHLIQKIAMGEALNLAIKIPSNFFSAEALTLR